MQSLPCLNKVIWFSRQALLDIQCAERYTELSHIIVQGPSFGKKGRLRAFIERHFRGSKPLQIFTKLRPIIVYIYIYIYTIVACAFKWKSSAARSAFNLTAETQGLSSKVHSIGTTEPMRITRRHVCANVSFYINSLSIGRLISSEVC